MEWSFWHLCELKDMIPESGIPECWQYRVYQYVNFGKEERLSNSVCPAHVCEHEFGWKRLLTDPEIDKAIDFLKVSEPLVFVVDTNDDVRIVKYAERLSLRLPKRTLSERHRGIFLGNFSFARSAKTIKVIAPTDMRFGICRDHESGHESAGEVALEVYGNGSWIHNARTPAVGGRIWSIELLGKREHFFTSAFTVAIVSLIVCLIWFGLQLFGPELLGIDVSNPKELISSMTNGTSNVYLRFPYSLYFVYIISQIPIFHKDASLSFIHASVIRPFKRFTVLTVVFTSVFPFLGLFALSGYMVSPYCFALQVIVLAIILIGCWNYRHVVKKTTSLKHVSYE